MNRTALLLAAVLCLAAFAADGAAVAPRRGAADASVGNDVVSSIDAITVPQMLSYQGKLTDTTGVPVADTLYAVRFRLYAQPTGGTQFWEENQQVRTQGGLFSTLLGSLTPIGSVPDAGALYLGMAVAGGAELSPRLRIASAAYAYLSARAANSDLLQGRDTTTFSRSTHNHDASYVNEGQADAVTGAMLVNGTVLTADVGDTAVTMGKIARAGATTGQVVKWTGSAWAPGPDNTGGGSGVTNVYQDTGITCVPNPITSTGNVKLDLSYGDGRYVNEAQANSVTSGMITDGNVTSADIRDTTVTTAELKDGAVTSAKILDATVTSADIRDTTVTTAKLKDAAVTAPKLSQMGASSGQVMKWTGSAWAPRNDSVGGAGDNAWIRSGGDSVLYTIHNLGIARGGAGNMLYGTNRFTHVNLGVACTTGTSGQNYSYATVGGGSGCIASHVYSTVAGGQLNEASGGHSTVGGGYADTASGSQSIVGGGIRNIASNAYSTVAGGANNRASGQSAVVAGGELNEASGDYSTVGGYCDTTSGSFSTVGGGIHNIASNTYSTVAGGESNKASGCFAMVGGGHAAIAGDAAADTAAVVAGGWSNSATGEFSAAVGGRLNRAAGTYSFVGGGHGDSARGAYSGALSGFRNEAGDLATDTASVIAGGWDNTITGRFSTIGGGDLNEILCSRATIAGGDSNSLEGGTCGAIGGGRRNSVGNAFSTVAGGYDNDIDDQYSAIGGGLRNYVGGKYCVVAGGDSNTTVTSYHAVVSGGSNNYIDEEANYSAVGGGRADSVRSLHGVVGGGYSNYAGDAADDTAAVIAGGWNNTATGKFNSIGGGYQNNASNNYATIGGGNANTVNGPQATVGGGWGNTASGYHSAIAGGLDNVASGTASTVSGGEDNAESGYWSAVAGGRYDTCQADYAMLAGYNVRARAAADYTLAFGENCSTSTPRAVIFFHSGAATKLGVGVQTPTHNIDVQGGAYCNGTNWVNGSSRKLKTDISVLTPAQMEDVIEELERTQVVTYRYKCEPNGEQHIGLIAEDAPELMATPDRDGINTADAIGFLLAAVKAQQAEIDQLKAALQAR